MMRQRRIQDIRLAERKAKAAKPKELRAFKSRFNDGWEVRDETGQLQAQSFDDQAEAQAWIDAQ